MSYVNEQTNIVSITPIAIEKVLGMMSERALEDYSLRVFVSGATCSGVQYGLACEETPHADDIIVSTDGLQIVVDPNSLPYVQGVSIDFIETSQGAGFRVDNPNVSPGGVCGGGCCG